MSLIDVQVRAVRSEAQGVNSYELRPVAGGELPAFTAGAHVDLHLPNGLTRSYSLTNPQGETDRYVIAVSKSATSTPITAITTSSSTSVKANSLEGGRRIAGSF